MRGIDCSQQGAGREYRWDAGGCLLYLGLHTILPSPILYGVWHKKEVLVWGGILRDGGAIVLE